MFLLDVLQLCTIALITTLLLYFTGSVFINVVSSSNIKTPRNLFFSIFWGAIIIISTAAIIRTGGSSIFLLTIIPVLIIIKHKIEIEEITWGKLSWQILSTIVVYIGVTLFLLYFPYRSNVENDMSFYSKISQYLFTLGKENSYHYFNEIMLVTAGNTPYHYFELYFNGLIGWIVSPHFTHMFLLKFLTIPLFITYTIIGLQNFILYRPNKLSASLSSFFVILVLFINFEPLANVIFPSWPSEHFIFTRSIFIFYYLLLTAAFLSFYKNKNYYILTAYILLLPVISATTTPAIYSGAILFYIFLLITKKITRNAFFKLSGLIILSALLFFLFYLFTGTSTKGAVPAVELQTLIDIILSLWKAIAHQIVTLSLRTVLFALWPALIIYIIKRKRTINLYPLLIFSVLITFAGIVIFQLIHTLNNSYQIPYIGYTSIAIVLAISLILLYNYTKNQIRVALLLTAGILAFFSNINRKSETKFKHNITYNYLLQRGYQMDDIKKMEILLNNSPEEIVKAGFMYKEKTQARDLTKPAVFQHGNDFFIFKDEFTLYPLTPLNLIETGVETDLGTRLRVEQLKEELPFYKNPHRLNDTEYINNYILHNHLSFIITEERIVGLAVPTIVIPVVN